MISKKIDLYKIKGDKNYFWLIATSGLELMLSILSLTIWLKFVDSELFVEYKIIIFTFILIQSLCLPGLSHAITIVAANEDIKTFRLIILVKLLFSILLVLIFYYVFFFFLKEEALKLDFSDNKVLLFLLPFFVVSNNWIAWCTGNSDFKFFFYSKFWSGVTNILILYIFTIYEHIFNLNKLIVIHTLIESIPLIIILFKRNSMCLIDRTTVKYGINASAALSLGSITQVDRFIIFTLLPLSDFNSYIVAQTFLNYGNKIFEIGNKLISKNSVLFSDEQIIAIISGTKLRIYFIYTTISVIGSLVIYLYFKYIIGDLDQVLLCVTFWISNILFFPIFHLSRVMILRKKLSFLKAHAAVNIFAKTFLLWIMLAFLGSVYLYLHYIVVICLLFVFSLFILNKKSPAALISCQKT